MSSQKSVSRFVSNDFTVRVAAVDATEVVQEMQNIHQALPLATLGVGRSMVGALLMASQLKEGQEVGILLKGNGPLGSVFAQASFEGMVRGYCPSPHYQAPHAEDALSLRKAMGFGHLTISRQQPFQRQPYSGTVELVTGEVGDDIAHYLHQSHQIRSLVSLGVYLDTFGKVKAAGGVLLEVMPGVEESLVEKIQANADQHHEQISKLILQGQTPEQLVLPFLDGIPFTKIPHDYPIRYSCPCTLERVSRALGLLSIDDLDEMIAENKPSEVTCQMCGRLYQIPVEDLELIKTGVRKNSLH